jgi:alkanesulfonate monooxygenase SsuD/methylene tetrahydromethanopterin reductase-like flavin-dependent oxidoreductase (luciferase family)
VSFHPRPVQRPHPPILVGGNGPRVFRRIAAHGDGWLPMAIGREEARRSFARIRATVRETGRDPDRLWFRQEITWSSGGHGAQTIARVHRPSDDGATAAPAGVATTADTALAQLRELLAMGVNLVSIAFAWDRPDELVEQLEDVGRDVIAVVRRNGPPGL